MTYVSKMSGCLLIKFAVLAVCSAYPQFIDTDYDESFKACEFSKGWILSKKRCADEHLKDNSTCSFDKKTGFIYRIESLTRQLAKRAFDRLDGNEFGLFKRSINKRAFDRLDMADFGFRRKRGFDRIARAEFGLTGLRKKRAFERLFPDEYGLREKRALDRIDGSEFGLIKRSAGSYPEREQLINDLADSIVALRHGLRSEGATSDILEVPVTADES